jgi:hypothetical protein
VNSRLPRIAAGAAVLIVLLILSALLVPPYAANWRLQSYVNDLADDPATAKLAPQVVQAQVLNQAASLGLPVHAEDVRVAINKSAVRIDILYIVHVNLAGYAIDLHFRPAAGG